MWIVQTNKKLQLLYDEDCPEEYQENAYVFALYKTAPLTLRGYMTESICEDYSYNDIFDSRLNKKPYKDIK